ncbi:MAG: hypothetical protein P9M14_16480 [Candidatus Alcyoniella australis]|nr:hypothetical protein [Candidatus Alcyoniella australis]
MKHLVRRTQRDIAELVRERARELVPKRTHELERSIIVVETPRGCIVGSDKRYAATVHDGEPLPGPHEIVPRRGKALRFTIGGKTVFARRVQHPGASSFPSTPYLRDAVKDVLPKAEKLILARFGEEVVRQFKAAGFRRGMRYKRLR